MTKNEEQELYEEVKKMVDGNHRVADQIITWARDSADSRLSTIHWEAHNQNDPDDGAKKYDRIAARCQEDWFWDGEWCVSDIDYDLPQLSDEYIYEVVRPAIIHAEAAYIKDWANEKVEQIIETQAKEDCEHWLDLALEWNGDLGEFVAADTPEEAVENAIDAALKGDFAPMRRIAVNPLKLIQNETDVLADIAEANSQRGYIDDYANLGEQYAESWKDAARDLARERRDRWDKWRIDAPRLASAQEAIGRVSKYLLTFTQLGTDRKEEYTPHSPVPLHEIVATALRDLTGDSREYYPTPDTERHGSPLFMDVADAEGVPILRDVKIDKAKLWEREPEEWLAEEMANQKDRLASLANLSTVDEEVLDEQIGAAEVKPQGRGAEATGQAREGQGWGR